ncbi:hypothetical protein THUN1379_32380 [Paludibacterium sp. THUN1379]|nr:hypothetical protein THUN1379_32380 [Paludibacterium sp. THUN1379]
MARYRHDGNVQAQGPDLSAVIDGQVDAGQGGGADQLHGGKMIAQHRQTADMIVVAVCDQDGLQLQLLLLQKCQQGARIARVHRKGVRPVV